MSNQSKALVYNESPVARWLFRNVKSSWLWLIVRVYLGYEWLTAGLHKVESDAWMKGGAALKGYWTNAVTVPEGGKSVVNYDWYRAFLQSLLDSQSYVWFGKLVAIGETLVGVALILGVFTGLAAFFGGFMNFNYLLAGTISTNPVLLVLAILVLAAWKVAGYWGLDRFVLRWLKILKDPRVNSAPGA